MFTEIQTKSKDFAQNQNGWFFNDFSKIVKKFSQMQNLGQLGPENCRAYVFFACFCFVFVFVLFFVFLFFPLFFFFLFPPLFFYSSPDLNLHLYSILHDFSFKNTKFSASEKAHPPQTPPVCASMQLALTHHQIIPNVEDGCTALCNFGVLAVVKCCKQCLIAMIFFLCLYINSRLFYLSLMWRMKINLFTKSWGKLLTNKRNVFTWWSLFTL